MLSMRQLTIALTSYSLTVLAMFAAHAAAQDSKPVSNLKVGVAKVDITPPDSAPTVGHPRPTKGARDPLRAGVLILDDGKTKAAIATFDLLDAFDSLVKRTRTAISEKTGVPAENILVNVSHNHSGSDFEKNPEWADSVIEKISAAAAEASAKMKPVTVGYGVDKIGFSINRRKVINGRAVVRLNPDGPNDQRVRVLRFDDGNSLTPVAVLMHAVCHPCFFTWGDNATEPHPNGFPMKSADFPGEAQTFIEKAYDNDTKVMFLQGCAGDIRPNLPGDPYRCADEADIQWAGRDLGGAVLKALAKSMIREERASRPTHYKLKVASERISLPAKDGGKIEVELMAIKIGPYLLLAMPGEPMVEYGLRLEEAIADRAVPIVLGYSNGKLGYIATAGAHAVGGYEPTQSPVTPEAEEILLRGLNRMADKVVGDVFETFNKHPSDVKMRVERDR
jgi:hypothetical protein